VFLAYNTIFYNILCCFFKGIENKGYNKVYSEYTMVVLEYIWLDSVGCLRSKIRCDNSVNVRHRVPASFPDWNFDGSSTGQALGNDSEIILKPCAVYGPYSRNGIIGAGLLVLCDTWKRVWNSDRTTHHLVPAMYNHRQTAVEIFNNILVKNEQTWFGLEQEYFLKPRSCASMKDFSDHIQSQSRLNAGQFYCGVGTVGIASAERKLVEEHMQLCLLAGINISGINAEVAPSQWEFQVGPCVGIDAADQLWVARYLLIKTAEKYDFEVVFTPKLVGSGEYGNDCAVNGSGCHTNFSTETMRNCQDEPNCRENGIREDIMVIMDRLSARHNDHMMVYGLGNNARMTGGCETSSYDQFSYGVGDRGASVRIPTDLLINGCGYIEDRRPAANCDPYMVTSILASTAILGVADNQ
jgi:glutamine synthetase